MVECLPEFYEQIIWFLIEKNGYKECQLNENISYIIDDNANKNRNEYLYKIISFTVRKK